MTHAGQSSRTARLAKIRARQEAEFRTQIEDMIWGQTVRHAPSAPAWVRPTVIGGGLLVALIWLLAWVMTASVPGCA